MLEYESKQMATSKGSSIKYETHGYTQTHIALNHHTLSMLLMVNVSTGVLSYLTFPVVTLSTKTVKHNR